MHRNQDLDFAVFQAGVFERRQVIWHISWTGKCWEMTSCDFYILNVHGKPLRLYGGDQRFFRLGGFDETLLSWQDVDLHVRAIAAGLRDLRFPEIDYHFRMAI